MKRKKLVKLLMALGLQRNQARQMARTVRANKVNAERKGEGHG